MADGQDYTQDPAFLNAPPEQQHAYLAANNPNYAQSPPEIQKAYIDHVNGGTHGERTAALTPPVAPQPSGPQPNKVGKMGGPETAPMKQYSLVGPDITPLTREQSNEGNTGAASGVLAGTGLVDAGAGIAKEGLLKYGTKLLRSGAKMYAGQKAGGYVGNDIGGKTGETIGRVTGGVTGLMMPDSALARVPYVGRALFGADELADFSTADKLAQQRADIRGGATMDPAVKAHAEMESDISKGHQSRVAAKNEMDQEISEGHQFRVGANNEMNQDITEGRQGRAAARDTAHEDLAQARMRRGREQGSIDKAAEIEREGSTRGNEGTPARWTNERVQELAAQGNRDAIMELRQRGMEAPPNSRYVAGDVNFDKTRTGPLARTTLETEPTTITPGSKVRGVRVGQPRGGEVIHFDEQGKPIVPMRGGDKGLTNPESVLGEQFPAPERRTAPRVSALNSAPPDPVREARLDELRKAVRDPSLSDRDRSIVQSQLSDMESNPGERNTLGDNPSQLKKPKPTMSREEAEAASKKREEGRNARFK